MKSNEDIVDDNSQNINYQKINEKSLDENNNSGAYPAFKNQLKQLYSSL